MSFGKSVKAAFSGWNRYQGVATRSEFWWFQLFSITSTLGLAVVGALVLGPFGDTGLDVAALVLAAYLLSLVVVGLSLTVRRLRDAGLSWGLIFLHVVPLLGATLLFILALFPSRSTSPSNLAPDTAETANPPSSFPSDEVQSKIRRLGELRDAGKISDEKFEVAKRKLLES